MNCSEAQKKIIFSVEKTLPATEMKLFEDHISGCSQCMELYKKTEKALHVFSTEKHNNPNPFLFARIEQKLSDPEKVQLLPSPLIIRLLKPALITVLVAGAVFTGYILGNLNSEEVNQSPASSNYVSEMAGQYQMNASKEDIIETYYLTE